MKTKLLQTFFLTSALLLIAGTMSAQTNLLQGGGMESETGWSTSTLNSSVNFPAATWNNTSDAPVAGVDGNLHVTGLASGWWVNVQYAIYQPVTLSNTETYTFDGAFKALKYGESWLEVYLGTRPEDGNDYGDGQNKIVVVGAWDQPANDDGTFSVDASNYSSFTPDTSGTYYFVLKMGTGNPDNGFEFIVDELSLVSRAKPIVKFNGPANGFTGATVSFTDASIYADSWSWDFGDGSAASTDQNPSHVYAAPGTYTVSLTATNELGSNTLVKTDMIVVEDPPVEVTAGGVIQGGEMESDAEWTVTLLNTAVGSEPVATWNNTADNAPAAGQGGNLHVTGTTTSGNSQYCIYQAVELSADSVYKLDGAFNFIQVNNSWCEVFVGEEPIDGLDYRAEDGFSLKLLAGVGTWATPAKFNGTFAIDANPYNVFIPDTSGTYFFVLKTGSTSWDGSTQTFEIVLDELSLTAYREKPYTAFSSDNAVGFAPLTVDFVNETHFATSSAWDFGDGATSTDEDPTHTYSDAGVYTVTLSATNEKGDSVVTKTDFVKANEKPELPAGEMLYGGNMEDPNLWNITNLNANIMPTTATWNYVDQSAAHGAGGGLYISASVKNGTTHYCIWQPVELHQDSVYTFTGAFRALTELNQFWAEVFIGDVAPVDGEDYGADSIKLYQFNTWAECTGSLVDGTFQDDGCEFIGPYQPEETGTYYFVIKVGSGEWSNAETFDFEVILDEVSLQESTYAPAAVADFFSDVTEGDAPLTVFFTDLSENATSWDWDFGDGGTSTEQHPSYTYENAGVYTVTLVASNDAGSDILTVEDLITVNAVDGIATSAAERLRVYPNPSSGTVHVDLPEGLRGEMVVTGILGNEVMRRELHGGESTVNMEIAEQGVFIILVNSGTKTYRNRIVIR